MKAILAALLVQFAELRPQIRVDADHQAASFETALRQAHDAAAEPVAVDPVNVQLEGIRKESSEIKELVLELIASVTDIDDVVAGVAGLGQAAEEVTK